MSGSSVDDGGSCISETEEPAARDDIAAYKSDKSDADDFEEVEGGSCNEEEEVASIHCNDGNNMDVDIEHFDADSCGEEDHNNIIEDEGAGIGSFSDRHTNNNEGYNEENNSNIHDEDEDHRGSGGSDADTGQYTEERYPEADIMDTEEQQSLFDNDSDSAADDKDIENQPILSGEENIIQPEKEDPPQTNDYNAASNDDEEKQPESDEEYLTSCLREYTEKDTTLGDETEHITNIASRGDKNDLEAARLQRSITAPPVTRSRTRKKVKHRHCKAAIMIFVTWGITIALVSIVLGMDSWWGVSDQLFATKNEDDLCTLCGDNGLNFRIDEIDVPTRQPTHWVNNLPSLYLMNTPMPSFTETIKKPPEDLANICAPSILLHRDMIERCIRSCMLALCCLDTNEEAQEGLVSMLSLIGISGVQASSYLSTIDDCYQGNNVPICDSYNMWCSTLYNLDFVLNETLPEYFDTCSHEQPQSDQGGTIIAYERSYIDGTTANDDCAEEMCSSVECCHGNAYGTPRKRQRQHIESHETLELEERRVEFLPGCQGLAEEEMSDQICNAYAPLCGFQSTDNPSSMPSEIPTEMESSYPSILSSELPSIQPSKSYLPTSSSPTSQPSAPPSLILSLTPSLLPSNIPSTGVQLTTSEPSNEKSSSPSSSSNPSASFSSQPSSSPSVSTTKIDADIPLLESETPSKMLNSSLGAPTIERNSTINNDTDTKIT